MRRWIQTSDWWLMHMYGTLESGVFLFQHASIHKPIALLQAMHS